MPASTKLRATAGEHKYSRANHRANSERDQIERAKRPLECLFAGLARLLAQQRHGLYAKQTAVAALFTHGHLFSMNTLYHSCLKLGTRLRTQIQETIVLDHQIIQGVRLQGGI
jgi:hypothetical protein